MQKAGLRLLRLLLSEYWSFVRFRSLPCYTCTRTYMEAEVATGCDTLIPRAAPVPKALNTYRTAEIFMISLMKLCSKEEDNSTRVCKCYLGSEKVTWYTSSIREGRGARSCYKTYIDGPFYPSWLFSSRCLATCTGPCSIVQYNNPSANKIGIVGSDAEKMRLHQEKQPPQ